MEVVAVGTAVGEEFDDFDLRRVVGRLRRLDVDVIAAQRELRLRRHADQQAGSEGDKGGKKIALLHVGISLVFLDEGSFNALLGQLGTYLVNFLDPGVGAKSHAEPGLVLHHHLLDRSLHAQ